MEDGGDVPVGFLAPAHLEHVRGAGGESEVWGRGRRREGGTTPIRPKQPSTNGILSLNSIPTYVYTQHQSSRTLTQHVVTATTLEC